MPAFASRRVATSVELPSRCDSRSGRRGRRRQKTSLFGRARYRAALSALQTVRICARRADSRGSPGGARARQGTRRVRRLRRHSASPSSESWRAALRLVRGTCLPARQLPSSRERGAGAGGSATRTVGAFQLWREILHRRACTTPPKGHPALLVLKDIRSHRGYRRARARSLRSAQGRRLHYRSSLRTPVWANDRFCAGYLARGWWGGRAPRERVKFFTIVQNDRFRSGYLAPRPVFLGGGRR
jgi:hypothetical protein